MNWPVRLSLAGAKKTGFLLEFFDGFSAVCRRKKERIPSAGSFRIPAPSQNKDRHGPISQ